MADAAHRDEAERAALRLFEECLDLPASAREARLQAACGNASDLRVQVKRLLAIAATGAEIPPIIAVPEWADMAEKEHVAASTRLGPWEVADRIGAGGMGEVFRGHRGDGAFDRTVAIKRIRPGQSDREIVARFKRERRVLAALEHQNIARLIDAGADADDVPYLVMEYVEGRRIDDYCDSGSLPVRERLQLFLKVCDAVHHAHGCGVIHRDLKPANILVTAQGEPKLLDFGIAGVIDAPRTLDEATLTGDSFGFMTPAYASPEQLRRAPLRAPSDQYSLAVILYELLAGVLPHDLSSLSPAEIERSVNEDAVLPPSLAVDRRDGMQQAAAVERASRRAASPTTLRRMLRGDLDRIVMMALRHEPLRRYASVADFAADLRRYLAGRPVRAQRDTVRYRALRFVRRNRVPVLIGSLVIVAISAALGVTLRALAQAREAGATAESERTEATNARRHAEDGLADADAASDFLANMLASSDPWEMGKDVKVREVLDKSARELDEKFASRPLIAGRIHMTLGQAYHRLGELATGREHAQRALEIFTQLLPEEDSRYRTALAVVADVRKAVGAFDEALVLFERSLALARRVWGEDHPEVLERLNDTAGVLRAMHRFAAAEALFRQVIAGIERTLGPDCAELCQPVNNLGLLLMQVGRLDEATQWMERAERLHVRFRGQDHPETLIMLINVAELAMHKKDHAEATRLLDGLLPRCRAVLGKEHQRTLWAERHRCTALFGAGRIDEAIALGRENLATTRHRFGMRDTESAAAARLLAKYLFSSGHVEEAEELTYEALVVCEALAPIADPARATSLRSHSVVLARLGQREQAAAELAAAIGLARQAGRVEASVVDEYYDLALLEQNAGRAAAAAMSYLAWLDLSPAERTRATDRVLFSLRNAGAHFANLGRHEEAEPLLLEAYFAACDRFGPHSPKLAIYAERLMQLHSRWRPEERPRWEQRFAELCNSPAKGSAAATADG